MYVSHVHVKLRTSPIRGFAVDSDPMLLFLLWPIEGSSELFPVNPSVLTVPSAVLLKPWVRGESSDMGLAAVSPVRSTGAVSMRDAVEEDWAFWLRTWVGEGG